MKNYVQAKYLGVGGKRCQNWPLADLYCITQKYFLKLISFFFNAP